MLSKPLEFCSGDSLNTLRFRSVIKDLVGGLKRSSQASMRPMNAALGRNSMFAVLHNR